MILFLGKSTGIEKMVLFLLHLPQLPLVVDKKSFNRNKELCILRVTREIHFFHMPHTFRVISIRKACPWYQNAKDYGEYTYLNMHCFAPQLLLADKVVREVLHKNLTVR